MVTNYDSLMKINDNKSKQCFLTRIIRLWKSTDFMNSEKSLTIYLILMDSHVHFF